MTPNISTDVLVGKARGRPSGRRAFTLIELLTTVAIIAILAGLVFVTLAKARAATESSRCQGNLRQLGVAAKLYGTDNRGEFPPAAFVNTLLPYVDRSSPVFWCPSDDRVADWLSTGEVATSGKTSYAYNADLIGLATQSNRWGTQCWVRAKTLPGEVARPDLTVLFLDAGNYYCRSANRNQAYRHGDALNILFADGHLSRFSGDVTALYGTLSWGGL